MKQFKIIATFTCFLLCCFSLTFAQTNVKVSGVVSDSKGETLVGVSIYGKSDPSRGVVTDNDGKYEINVKAGDLLVFSYIGFTVQEIKVGTSPNQMRNVVLEESTQMLEEVSVVGYGTQRKVSVVGSIATVKPDELKMGGISSITNNLAGRIAGLIGIQSSGEPGSDVSEFWIRGISTFGGATVLWC